MKYFIQKCTFVILIILILDLCIGQLANYLMKNIPESNAYVSHVIYSTLYKQADILILGASKAKHGIDPLMLEDSLHLETYNTGEDGCDMSFYNLMLQCFISRHKPKIVILDMAPLALSQKPNFPKFLYGLSKVTNNFCTEVEPLQERIKLSSNLYRLNGFFSLLPSTLLKKNKPDKGFLPLIGTLKDDKINTKADIPINKKEITFLNEVVNTCKARDIKLYIFISPTYFHNVPKFNKWLSSYCNTNNVTLFDMSTNEKFKSPELYYDNDHLNQQGANLYTNEIIRLIK